jgi:hypothetical protein
MAVLVRLRCMVVGLHLARAQLRKAQMALFVKGLLTVYVYWATGLTVLTSRCRLRVNRRGTEK